MINNKRLFRYGIIFFGVYTILIGSAFKVEAYTMSSSKMELVNELENKIKIAQLPESGYIYYSYNSFFSYTTQEVKFNKNDKQVQVKGDKGTFESGYDSNFYLLDQDLLVRGNNFSDTEVNAKIKLNKEQFYLLDNFLVKEGRVDQIRYKYLQDFKGGAFLYPNIFLKFIPELEKGNNFSIINFGDQRQYFKVIYKDKTVVYTVNGIGVVRVRVKTRDYEMILSIKDYPAKIILPKYSLLPDEYYLIR